MEFRPYSYQSYAIGRIERDPKVALFMDLGLGKSVIALTAANDMMTDTFQSSRCLVVAPLRVARMTWPSEKAKWEHLSGMRMSLAIGDERHRISAIMSNADVTVINRENIPWLDKWLISKGREGLFDLIVIDESTSFKSPSSQRFKSMRRLCRLAQRTVIMTGTPVPNGYLDLWAQIYLLDQGARLGTSMSSFKDNWFIPDQYGWNVARGCKVVYSWKPREGAEQEISSAIKDIAISMSAKDYLTMPEISVNRIPIDLSEDEMRRYRTMESDFILESGSNVIRADSAGVLAGKLLQLASGECYLTNPPDRTTVLHTRKLDALKDIVDDNSPKPVFVLYEYRHEKERILEALKEYSPRMLETEQDLDDWNSGRIQVLLGQPQSIGFGINLQAGGHIMVWYSLTWNLELWEQTIGRLYRQGQKDKVIVNCLVSKGTIDEKVMDALDSKKKVEDWMLDYVKEVRKDA